MSERQMSIVFSSGIGALTECNSSFDSGVLRVCYTGRNRNNSFISKETFERCIASIYNCPIVCRYERDTGTIGAHDMELVTDSDGDMKLVNITQPVGVIPESARYWWEEIEDDSGMHEYLCVDALIWKRQEAYKKIKEDGITEESMEITVKEGEMIDGIYVIKRFEFTAFCLLGTAKPCYESAALELFSCNDFKTKLAEMMHEFKEAFSLAQPSKEVGIYQQNNSMEGGDEVLEQKIALMAEFGLNADMLDFNIDDFTVEELRTKFEKIKSTAQTTVPKTKEDFALAEQFREELVNALSVETVETCFGEMTRYWYVDYDSEISEVYCYDTEDWKLYGFPYSMNGDNVSIDFKCKKRKKFSIIDFDEGEQPAVFAAVFESISAKFNESDAKWAEKYQAASDTISSMENELGTLRQFKIDTEDAVAKGKRDEIFAQFEDLAGIEAFEHLREHSMEYSAEDLEEKCYAIRGRHGAAAKFSYEPKTPKLVVEKTGISPEPYGGVFAEYGITSGNQYN